MGLQVHLSMKNNNATAHNLRTQRKEPRDQSEQKNCLRRDEEIRRNTKKIKQGRQWRNGDTLLYVLVAVQSFCDTIVLWIPFRDARERSWSIIWRHKGVFWALCYASRLTLSRPFSLNLLVCLYLILCDLAMVIWCPQCCMRGTYWSLLQGFVLSLYLFLRFWPWAMLAISWYIGKDLSPEIRVRRFPFLFTAP